MGLQFRTETQRVQATPRRFSLPLQLWWRAAYMLAMVGEAVLFGVQTLASNMVKGSLLTDHVDGQMDRCILVTSDLVWTFLEPPTLIAGSSKVPEAWVTFKNVVRPA